MHKQFQGIVSDFGAQGVVGRGISGGNFQGGPALLLLVLLTAA